MDLKTNHKILIALFFYFEIICNTTSFQLTGLEEQLDCKSAYEIANETITTLGKNWQDELIKKRENLTEELIQCKQNLNTTEYLPSVSEYFDYAIGILKCPGARSNWTVVAIIFIIAFLLSTSGLIVVSALYYKNLRRNI
ncbi:hypothetical protein Mgra_00006062 [Meloidogyne graminicola]|uniref:Uncharacterized protein n=1 Tax=Meloidogyne graminicola TaxID=189291 RepID=A0A8S9ZME6_9BILA|nr:hypothetical protein Mgra_00006062 [Meloidogyne graminicola]